MLEPIVKEIEVPCDQAMAFEVFLEGMESWWPLGKFTVSGMKGERSKGIEVEPRLGGRIVEVAYDDTRHHWGTLVAYEPSTFLALDFHIAPPESPVDQPTVVEVRFSAISKDRTRVELRQTRWEGLGEWFVDIRDGYEKGWRTIFEQDFKSACKGLHKNKQGRTQ